VLRNGKELVLFFDLLKLAGAKFFDETMFFDIYRKPSWLRLF